jgi:hypothetical protein
MYQNIYYERQKNLIHLWDDKSGYQTFPYRKYAYKKDPYGEYRSMYGDKLTKVGKWEKEDAEDLFESDVPETTRVLVDIYDNDLPSVGHRTLTFDIEVEMNQVYQTHEKQKTKLLQLLHTMEQLNCMMYSY